MHTHNVKVTYSRDVERSENLGEQVCSNVRAARGNLSQSRSNILPTDNGHPERAFFQKFETFGLGQTNWAEILGGILAISSQTIGTILAL